MTQYLCRDLIEILDDALMDKDSSKQFKMLDAIKDIFEHNPVSQASPRLTQLFLEKLFMIIKNDSKEVMIKAEINQIISISPSPGIPSSRSSHHDLSS